MLAISDSANCYVPLQQNIYRLHDPVLAVERSSCLEMTAGGTSILSLSFLPSINRPDQDHQHLSSERKLATGLA